MDDPLPHLNAAEHARASPWNAPLHVTKRTAKPVASLLDRTRRPYPHLDRELERFGRQVARRLDTTTRRIELHDPPDTDGEVWVLRVDDRLPADDIAAAVTGIVERARAVLLDVDRAALGEAPLARLVDAFSAHGHRVAGAGFAPVHPLPADRVVALLAGDWYMEPVTAPDDFRVTAIMTAFNEADIIRPTIERLIADGIEVHLIDNWSSDGTAELVDDLLGHGLTAIERFPAQGPPDRYEWERLLARVAEIAHASNANWCVHHDADQRRESPWSGVSYRSGLYSADRAGFNAVDHTLFEFRPVDDGYVDGTELIDYFRHFELVPSARSTVHVQAWKNLAHVDLASSGGHDAAFDARRVYPLNFTLRHHPIRSQEHGERKVFRDRKPRYEQSELDKGWHYHYARLRTRHAFLHRSDDLHVWIDEQVHADYFLPRTGQVCIPDRDPGRVGAAKAATIRAATRTGTLKHLVRLRAMLRRSW